MATKTKGAKQAGKKPAKQPVAVAPKKLPTTVKKPARPTKPSLPLPPPPPAPPPQRDELDAPKDIARLLRYGEKFGGKRIDVRMLQVRLPVMSGAIAICDPGVPKSWKVLDRPVGNGVFGVMLSVARGGPKDELAAVTIHVGRPPIARWTVAHAKGQKTPKSADQVPVWPATTGWLALADAGSGSPGTVAVSSAPAATIEPVDVPLTDGRHVLAMPSGNGEFTAYWAIDAADKPVCLVIDFEAFTQKEWKAKPS